MTPGARRGRRLREQVEDALAGRGFAELPVYSFAGLCARLLHDEALEAGLDPFFVTATIADRRAMLLERVDELTLRAHDFRGSPATMLGAIVARIDRLKELGITAADVARARRSGRPARARVRRALRGPRPDARGSRARWTPAEMVLRAHELLAERPHVRGAHGRALEATCSSTSWRTRPPRRCASRWRWRPSTARSSSPPARPSRCVAAAPPTSRAVRTALPRAEVDRAARQPPLPTAHPAGRSGGRVRCRRRRVRAQWRRGPGEVALLARRQRAGSGAERRGRDRAAACARAPTRGASPCSCAASATRARRVAVALEERAVPYRLVGAAAFFQRAEVRDVLAWLRLLIDPSDAGAVVRALARPPVELRSVDLARCIQIARRRKLDMVGALVAATESPQLDPAARERVLGFLKLHRAASAALDTQRPDLFVHRLIDRLGPAPPAALRRAVRRRRAAGRAGATSASWRRRSCAVARRRRRASSRAGSPRWPRPAAPRTKRPGRRARGAGAVVGAPTCTAPRGSSSTTSSSAGCSPRGCRGRGAAWWSRSRRELLPEGVEPDDRAAHVAEMRGLLHVAMTRARKSPGARLRRALRRGRAAAAVAVRRGGASGAGRASGRTSRRSSSAPTRRCTRCSPSCATSCWAASARSARDWASCAWTPSSTSPTASRATSSC